MDNGSWNLGGPQGDFAFVEPGRIGSFAIAFFERVDAGSLSKFERELVKMARDRRSARRRCRVPSNARAPSVHRAVRKRARARIAACLTARLRTAMSDRAARHGMRAGVLQWTSGVASVIS